MIARVVAMESFSLRDCFADAAYGDHFFISCVGVVHLKRSTGHFLFLLFFVATPAFAGPPFDTDDPEPVDFLHWEFYLSSIQHFQRSGNNATLPHVEINYGAFPNVQLHVLAPMGYVRANGHTSYGIGDIELGVKYRFVEETESTPQVGTFPLVEIPTGDRSQGLGNGQAQIYLPLWIQKSWGDFTTYGGGGYWYNPGPDQKNWIFAGWEVQYTFSKVLTLGGEIIYHTADSQTSGSEAAFNVGGYVNLNENDHILFSIGRSMRGDGAINGYVGFQLTI